MTIAETFDNHWLENENGCWIWQRACKGKEVASGGGYGCLSFEGKTIAAHHFSYERINGPIPKGLQLRHQCHQTKCVNPDHILLGTNFDNTQDKLLAGRYPSKLTIWQVRVIKRAYRVGIFQRVIAARFNLHQADVSNIVNGKYWTHVRA